MDKLELVLELLKENREDIKEVKSDISVMKVDVALNKDDLVEHMNQTRAVRELAVTVREEANARIDSIERKLTVGHLLKLVVTVAGGIGTIAGAIWGITRII